MWKTVIIEVSGTMQRVVLAENANEAPKATSLIVQMQEGSGGDVGYLQMGVPIGTDLDHTAAIQLPKGAAGIPGTPFIYQVQHPAFGERINIGELGIDGANTGDKILVMWWEVSK